jgi:hypothetical protein
MKLEDAAHTITVCSDDIYNRCEHCDFALKSGRMEELVEHYVQEHGYEIIETRRQTTPDGFELNRIVILGKPKMLQEGGRLNDAE